MKRIAHPHGKSARFPISWREAEYAALRFNAADTCDDRVSDSIFDLEDERAVVELVRHEMMRDAD